MSAESGLVQWQTALDNLVNSPPTGRVTIQVSPNLKNWVIHAARCDGEAGDILIVPKRPSFVMVQGQVYGPTAVAYRPGKSARWYLTQAGRPTNMANKRATFVIRADGTVWEATDRLDFGRWLECALQPGDLVVVPEKVLGGPPVWKTLFAECTGAEFHCHQCNPGGVLLLVPEADRWDLRGTDSRYVLSGKFDGVFGQTVSRRAGRLGRPEANIGAVE